MDSKNRFNQLEELLSNVMMAVDKLTADMQELREYTRENNKVVNAILHKLDDHAEQFQKNDERFAKHDQMFGRILEEMSADRKLRDAQFEFLLKKVS